MKKLTIRWNHWLRQLAAAMRPTAGPGAETGLFV